MPAELLSPYAPLWPWLLQALPVCAPLYFRLPCEDEDMTGWGLDYRAGAILDLRNGSSRFAVLSALASVDYPLPWALGGIWSPLTDEQAGRVVAETIRRVGEDPGKPLAAVPIGIVKPWTLHQDGICMDRWWALPKDRKHRHYDYYTRFYLRRYGPSNDLGGWHVNLGKLRHFEPVIGEAGRDAADAFAFANGALLWEQVTPEVKA